MLMTQNVEKLKGLYSYKTQQRDQNATYFAKFCIMYMLKTIISYVFLWDPLQITVKHFDSTERFKTRAEENLQRRNKT